MYLNLNKGHRQICCIVQCHKIKIIPSEKNEENSTLANRLQMTLKKDLYIESKFQKLENLGNDNVM